MNDPNRLMKWLFVVGLVALSLVVLYPPHEKLKGGIDLVGGTSLLFEIDTTGLTPRQQRDLSTNVMQILKERVDPKGQLNLEWRPVGNTRLEIRMPRPPKTALARRAKYNEALERLRQKNLTRFEVESALDSTEDARATRLEDLVRGVGEREALIEALVTASDAYAAARRRDEGVEAALDAYEESMGDLLATSLPITRFTDILALPSGDKREAELNTLRAEHPSFDAGPKSAPGGQLLSKAVETYDAWAANKADLEDPSDLKRRLRGAGVLEFRILADRDPNSPGNTRDPSPQLVQPIEKYVQQLMKYGPRPKAGDRYRWFPVEDVVKFMHLKSLSEYETQKESAGQPIVEEYAGRHYVLVHNDAEYGLLQGAGRKTWSLQEAYPDTDPLTGRNVVAFRLDPRGGRWFGELTEKNLQRSLCIMLDDVAMSHAVIQSRITERGQITGDFTVEKVQNLVRTFQAGSLPARLKETPLMENTVGPSLGEANRSKGLKAAALGAALVALFVLVYYGIAAGGMANIALAMNLLLVLSIMAFIQATFTLPGIAGLILTVGMAIDANVLIFERIREERDRGVVFRKALNTGYDKAFSTIMDANLTTLITCIILGFVGSEEVKGFAIVLGIGISTSMFTALFVTRLIFNSLIAWGMLKDFSMLRLIGRPSVDWLALRRYFWPVSVSAVVAGMAVFVTLSTVRTEATYDIEFLGGTSLQLDLEPNVTMTDEEMTEAITSDDPDAQPDERSAVQWLAWAADRLEDAKAAGGEVPGQFTLTSPTLTGEQLRVLMKRSIEDSLQRGGTSVVGHTVIYDSKPGMLTLNRFTEVVCVGGTKPGSACSRDSECSLCAAGPRAGESCAKDADCPESECSLGSCEQPLLPAAADYARGASERLLGARVQSVGELEPVEGAGLSFEVASIETNRELVQAALLATLGDKLAVQRAMTFTIVRDEELTKESFFVVSAEDHYLSDVVGGDANYDVRRFRGGAAVVVQLDQSESPLPIPEVERRLREVGLQPEFEQYRTRDTAIFPLGPSTARADGETGYRRFAVLTVDESLLYDDDPAQWTESVAGSVKRQVEAALGQEKSLSKVVQFAPQIAGQTKNKTMFAIILALASIVSYLWLRFGRKEYGLAAIVALVHDVAITLGLVGVSQFLFNTVVGKALAIDAFRMDLSMIAAVLTVIGYSLNDTIVVFDRIRENKGRVESLNPNIINQSINQTLSRTLLTSLTTFIVIFVLYAFGGKGVHGFSFALLIGVVVGTYSSLGVATPLLYRPKLLHGVVMVIVALAVIGLVFALVGHQTARLVMTGVVVLVCVVGIARLARGPGYLPAGRPVPA